MAKNSSVVSLCPEKTADHPAGNVNSTGRCPFVSSMMRRHYKGEDVISKLPMICSMGMIRRLYINHSATRFRIVVSLHN